MGGTRNTRMMSLLNYRLKITLQDGRNLIGQMLAFDKHMNLVLGDTEEFRKIKNKGKVAAGIAGREEKRSLGLVILRGETIVALSVEAPPPSGEKRTPASFIPGTGAGRPAGYVLLNNVRRGLPMAPPSATQLPVGLGAPSAAMMQPQVSAAPVSYNGRPPMGMPMPPPGFRPGMPMPHPGFRPGMPMPPPGFRPGMPMPPPGFRPPPPPQ